MVFEDPIPSSRFAVGFLHVFVFPEGKSCLTKSVSPMMVCDWLQRGGYCAKARSAGFPLLKTKGFPKNATLLWEVPFGGQNAIQ